MQSIKGSVGDGGANNASDVALLQAILQKVRRPATPGQPAGPYLKSYDGNCGPVTKKAIRDFQTDYVFVSAARNQSVAVANATAGQIKPQDATWKKLLALVPAAFANLRVLPGGKTVYVQASAEDLQAKLVASGSLTFAPAFRIKVRNCINHIYTLHGIAAGVCAKGDRRTFQEQYALWLQGPGITSAGPGESNHNFGMAVDLGFAGLRWLHADGEVDVNETSWLHHLKSRNSAECLVFWAALRAVGTGAAVGAFRGPESDRPHLQNWNDANVSMVARLAALLQASGTMKWSYAQGNYRSDLGLGGAQFAVGKAAHIWNVNAALNPANLTQARAAAAAAKNGPAPPPATAQDVTAMRLALRKEFELADANWQNWTSQ